MKGLVAVPGNGVSNRSRDRMNQAGHAVVVAAEYMYFKGRDNFTIPLESKVAGWALEVQCGKYVLMAQCNEALRSLDSSGLVSALSTEWKLSCSLDLSN